MPRAIEDYVCASEDRSHYNNEGYYPWGFQTPMRTPEVTIINQITKVVKEKISEEELTEIINARIPQITERVTAEVSQTILPEITEIDGGSASDLIEEGGDG